MRVMDVNSIAQALDKGRSIALNRHYYQLTITVIKQNIREGGNCMTTCSAAQLRSSAYGDSDTFELSLPVLYGGERHSDEEGSADLLYLKEVVQKGYYLHSLAEA